ncbi:MAG: alpha/beta hydrolase [Pseudomonadota bacterium]
MSDRPARFAVAVDGGIVHARAWGSGPPLLMLHPSPLSSAIFAGFVPVLSPHVTMIALDTPGYGQSSPLTSPPELLADYVPTVLAFLDGIGLDRVAVYGSATGAQLGIELARLAPDRVAGLILENAAHFSDADRERLLKGYFPDLTPVLDGTHLLRGWTMMRETSQVFPWYSGREADRINRVPPPLAMVHAGFLDLLRAGPDYAVAYRAAFANERAEQLAKVTVPTKVIRWESGLLTRWTEVLLDHDLPANIKAADAGPGLPARMDCIRTLAVDAAGSLPAADLSGVVAYSDRASDAAEVPDVESLPPVRSGAHLLELWQQLRDRRWWRDVDAAETEPLTADLDANALQRDLLAVLDVR